GDRPIDRVALLVEALALFHTHRPELALLGSSEMRSVLEPQRTRIVHLRNEMQHLLDEEISAAIDDGTVTTRHPRDAARAIATMCTALPQWFRSDGPRSPEQIAKEYAAFAVGLLRG
ncbi:MAG: transcriptional regulator, partial [Pseudonocardiales bacterium]|nr:transcriptional regulator [Pseudonocardiales bacterium]